jgi:methyl-accepting chemotaxis protein
VINRRVQFVRRVYEDTVETVVATPTDEIRERVASGATQETVGDDVASANAGVQSIGDATDEQAATSEQVVAVVDEVTSVSQQTAAEAQSVSAAEEQTASLAEVSDSADSLADRATDLSTLLDAFELGGAAPARDGDHGGSVDGAGGGRAVTDGSGRR